MKLLFDENLSPKISGFLKGIFPHSLHVRDCGLRGKSDEAVWGYAATNGFTFVSKDSDFQQRNLLYGSPPKLIWLRLGNCNRKQIIDLIIAHQQDIRALESDPGKAVLALS